MKNTLKNKRQIDSLFKNGFTISDNLVMIKWVDSTNTRFLFAVSSKIFKRAVDRNRIKRLMRESVFKISIKDKNVVILLKGNIIPSFEDINKSIIKLAKSL